MGEGNDPKNDHADGEAPQKGQIMIYQAKDETFRLDVRFEDESVWLTQQQMAELFQTTKQNISLHIKNIYSEGELFPQATVKEYLTVQTEGLREVSGLIYCYNRRAIMSGGME